LSSLPAVVRRQDAPASAYHSTMGIGMLMDAAPLAALPFARYLAAEEDATRQATASIAQDEGPLQRRWRLRRRKFGGRRSEQEAESPLSALFFDGR
jgi:hypothetical protein